MKNKFILYIMSFVLTGIFVFSVSYMSYGEEQSVAESVISPKKVIAGGEIVGIKLFTKGLLVIEVTDLEVSGKKISPGKDAGIKKGDYILKADNKDVTSIADFSKKIDNKNQVKITLNRDNKIIDVLLNPYISEDKKTTRAGLWVRDSSAGIGTITFYDNQNNIFAGLGHPICDADTEKVYTISYAECFKAHSFDIQKAKFGTPGEISGMFGSDSGIVGAIKENTSVGIIGKTTAKKSGKEYVIAEESELIEGDAFLLSNIEGDGVKSYKIKITKIIRGNNNSINGFIIKITDEKLLELTGGIIQGMSGSPIVQNGKLVGAVTHVFVNTPTKGYGIFIGDMLSETEKIK